jgi:hypothetical protein
MIETMTRGNESSAATGYLWVAFELSQRWWKVGCTTGMGHRVRTRRIAAGALEPLAQAIADAKKMFGLAAAARVISCYEAGRDGFWLHRYLTERGDTNYVVDSASIEVDRRARRTKTDAVDLARDHPENTSVQSMYLPTLRALFALDARNPAAAIQSLQTASRFDLATGGIGFNAYFGKLYPIYVRGLAYVAAQQPVEGAAEFQRIVDHRSIVLVDPIDALARLQLARALAYSGDTVQAKSACDDLFTLWKNADPDIPVLKAARAEYARLP